MKRAATPIEMDAFLCEVQQRAYRTAMLATHNHADALDIVQEAMFKLAEKYMGKKANEWPMLFHRILQNAIIDWHRKQASQRRWFGKPASLDDESGDNISEIAEREKPDILHALATERDVDKVLQAVSKLPVRQQQTVVLRAWEGFDVKETAGIMGCSEGSVKTHYFRALKQLRSCLHKPGRNDNPLISSSGT